MKLVVIFCFFRNREVLISVLVFSLYFLGCGNGGGSSSNDMGSGAVGMYGPATVTPRVAIDASGNAVAIWHQSDGTRYNILSNRYVVSTGNWGTAVSIETDNAGGTYNTQVAIDASGNTIAVWEQDDGTRYNIWANRYSASTGSWGTATLIETNNEGDAYAATVAVDSSGNAVAVWQQSDGTRFSVWANHYTASTDSWGTATLIETNNEGDAYATMVAINASGNAVAVWHQSDGSRYNIWANRYTAATDSWGTATLIETDNEGDALFPQVANDAAGNVMVVWQLSDGTQYNIWANRYTAATDSWGTATLIEADNGGNAYYPQVAINAAGNAVAVWKQSDGTRYNIWSNRYNTATSSWGTSTLIETNNEGDAQSPQVAIDPFGNSVAVWKQSDGIRYNIWSNRYSTATGNWGAATLIETNNEGDAYAATVAVNASGNAMAVWQQYDGARYNLWSNRFIASTGSWSTAALIETN